MVTYEPHSFLTLKGWVCNSGIIVNEWERRRRVYCACTWLSNSEIRRISWKGKLWILIRVSVLSIVETMKDLVRERSLWNYSVMCKDRPSTWASCLGIIYTIRNLTSFYVTLVFKISWLDYMNTMFSSPVTHEEYVVVYTPEYLKNMSNLVIMTDRR